MSYEYDDLSICLLNDAVDNPPKTCGKCNFFVWPSRSDIHYGVRSGHCVLNTEFDPRANWIYQVSNDDGCNSTVFLKKLIEVI